MLYRRWLKGLGLYQLYIQFLNIKVRAKIPETFQYITVFIKTHPV